MDSWRNALYKQAIQEANEHVQVESVPFNARQGLVEVVYRLVSTGEQHIHEFAVVAGDTFEQAAARIATSLGRQRE